MLHPEIEKELRLLLEKMRDFDRRMGYRFEFAEKDPEACIFSLMRQMGSELDSTASCLRMTLYEGVHDSGIKEAREILDKADKVESSPSATQTPKAAEKMLHKV